jgi:septum formation protein
MGVRFEVEPSEIDEGLMHPSGSPVDYVKLAARAKAEQVGRRLNVNAVIIGADTEVLVGREVLGKPASYEDAARMLRLLSGRPHKVLTGICVLLVEGDVFPTRLEDHVETEVRVRKLTDEMIDAYVRTGEPMDKAGAYAIQGRGCVLIEGIVGDYFNVVGLPIFRLSMMLERVGINPLFSPEARSSQ